MPKLVALDKLLFDIQSFTSSSTEEKSHSNKHRVIEYPNWLIKTNPGSIKDHPKFKPESTVQTIELKQLDAKTTVLGSPDTVDKFKYSTTKMK